MATVIMDMDSNNYKQSYRRQQQQLCESYPSRELPLAALADDYDCEASTGTGRNNDSAHTSHNTADASSNQEREPTLSMENGTPPDDIIIQNAPAHNTTTDATNTPTASATESRQERRERRRIVALYLVTITILFADMNLLAPNLSIIADEFGMLSDDERDVKLGGLLALGFFFVGAPVSFIVGWFADSMNRSPLFAGTVFFGEIGSLMVMFVRNYWQLYVCRVMTGISIGGSIPVIYSVLGDLYPANQRSAIAAVITTGTGLGMGIGQVIAGSLDSWRLPFVIVAIPGLVCSALVLFVKDPKRGAKEAAFLERRERHLAVETSSLSESERRTLQNSEYVTNLESTKALALCGMSRQVVPASPVMSSPDRLAVKDGAIVTQSIGDNNLPLSNGSCFSSNSTWKLLKVPSVVLTILQAAPGALPFGFCATFLNDFLQEQRGMSKEEVTGVLVSFGAGNAIGVIIAGFLGHFAYKRDVRGPPLIMGVSLILGCIPFYFLVNYVDKSASTAAVAGITTLSGMLVVMPVPLERSILTNVCLPDLRGRANALVSIFDDLGKGLGPALVSVLITTFDRQTAFNISLIGWIIGGALSLAIMMFVATDEESVQQQLREEMMHSDVDIRSCQRSVDDARRL